MATRLELQTKLADLLESDNVYYQPPESITMQYPAIRYTKSNITGKFADDHRYSGDTVYELTVIDRKPDNPVIDKLLELPYCSFNRHYKADNLNHDVFTIYF